MEKCPKCRGNKVTKTGSNCPACNGVGQVSEKRFKELRDILKRLYAQNTSKGSNWSIV